MAKRKRSRRSGAKAGGALPGKTIGSHSFGNRKFRCYGKSVRAGRSAKKVPRIFCARSDA